MTRWWARLLWGAVLAVAAAAAVATAHGLYEVALHAGQPPLIAALYPVLTDGLALVAYCATTQLQDRALRYAWAVIVAAAGLSGAVQAVQLAGGLSHVPPTWVRATIGAWVAVSFLLSVHLAWLVRDASRDPADVPADEPVPAAVSPSQARAVPPRSVPASSTGISARARAAELATTCHRELGAWPTVTSLAEQADVAHSTAQRALADAKNDYAASPATSNGRSTLPSG